MNSTAKPGVDFCSLENRALAPDSRSAAEETAVLFAAAVAQRDYVAIRQLTTEEVTVRALLPRGLEEWRGADATVDHFRFWYDRFLAAWGRSIKTAHVEDRFVTGWHHEGNFKDGSGRHVIEQRAVLQVGDEGITQIDLVCTGFRAVPDSEAARTLEG